MNFVSGKPTDFTESELDLWIASGEPYCAAPGISSYFLQSEGLVCKQIEKRTLDVDFERKYVALHAELGQQETVPGQLLTYPYILQDDAHFYFVRPWVKLPTLRQLIDEGQLTSSQILQLAISLADAIYAINLQGTPHQNLSPNNVLVDKNMQCRLMDGPFPRFKSMENGVEKFNARGVWYSAPEHLGTIDAPVDERTDLYSMGIILYECISGKTPFHDKSIDQLIYENVSGKVVELTPLQNDLPFVLEDITYRLLKKDPAHRYQSSRSVAWDLREIQKLSKNARRPHVVLGKHDQRTKLTQPGMVGRQEERNAFDLELQSTSHGHAGLVFVEAESGCGKTRLINEFARDARRRQFWVLKGQATNEIAQQPFEIMDGVIKGIIQRCLECDAYRSYLDAGLGEQKATLANALPIFGEKLDWQPDQRRGPEAFGEARTIQALCRLLELAATPDQPLVIFFDDCQWADDASIKLLNHWRRQSQTREDGARHLLVTLVFRAEEVDQANPLRKIQATSHLRLNPFTKVESMQLAQSMAGKLPPDALTTIATMAKGSPFMVTAILRGMVETEILVPEPTGWSCQLDTLQDLQSSSDAGDFLARRIELLHWDLLNFLSAAAILGKEFDTHWASQLARIPDDQRDSVISEAVSKNLIWNEGEGGKSTFVHDKIREALLGRMSVRQRQQLHHQAAQFIHSIHPDRIVDLAFHYDAAGHPRKALQFALVAANEARNRNSLALAEQQFLIASKGVGGEDASRKFQILRGLGDVRLLQGKYDMAEQSLREASLLATDNYDQVRVLDKMSELAFKRGNMEESTQYIEQAMSKAGCRLPRVSMIYYVLLLWEMLIQGLHSLFPFIFVGRLQRKPTPVEALRIRLHSRYAHAIWFTRPKAWCMWTHFRSLNLAEKYQPTPELARVHSDHAPAMSLVPFPRRGIEYAERSFTYRQSIGDLWGQGQSLHYKGIVLYGAARFEECVSTCRQAVRLLERTGDYWEVHIARYQIAASLYHLGDLEGALREARTIHKSGLDLGDFQATGMSLDVWARADMGNPSRRIFEEELKRHRADAQGTAQLLIGYGVRLLADQEFEAAAKQFRNALKTARQTGKRNAYVLPAYSWLATALRCQADALPHYHMRQRRRLVRQAKTAARLALFHSYMFRNNRPHALRELGLIYALESRVDKSLDLLQRAIRAAQDIHSKHEEQLCKLARKIVDPKHDSLPQLLAEIRAVPNAKYVLMPSQVDWTNEQNTSSISLADRFRRIMESGREITSALTEQAIQREAEKSAHLLLRGEHCKILPVAMDGNGRLVTDRSVSLDSEQLAIINEAIESGKAISNTSSRASEAAAKPGNHARSTLAAPLVVRGKTHSCLVVTHDEIADLFNQTERQLAEFIVTIAGAALDNADGFQKLQQLNETLEARVEQRTSALKRRAQDLADANRKLKRIAFELTQAQQDLEVAKDRAECANRAKSGFLATMSHEIRTPMNAVIGMTELCLRTPVTNIQRQYLEGARQSADSLLRILNDILDFSKIEANKMDLESIPFDLVATMEGRRATALHQNGGEGNRVELARRPGSTIVPHRRSRAAKSDYHQSSGQCDQIHSAWRGHDQCRLAKQPGSYRRTALHRARFGNRDSKRKTKTDFRFVLPG